MSEHTSKASKHFSHTNPTQEEMLTPPKERPLYGHPRQGLRLHQYVTILSSALTLHVRLRRAHRSPHQTRQSKTPTQENGREDHIAEHAKRKNARARANHNTKHKSHNRNNQLITSRATPGFVDEHPGGEEVLLDVGGQDSTEAFEDVGHSDEAREILEGLLVGTLKRGVSRLPIRNPSRIQQTLTLLQRNRPTTPPQRPPPPRPPPKPAPAAPARPTWASAFTPSSSLAACLLSWLSSTCRRHRKG